MMKEVEIQLILKSFKNNFLLRKILSFFCYFLIIFSLSFYLSNFFKKKQVVRIVSQLNASEQTINAEKIMINPRITIKHDDGKTKIQLVINEFFDIPATVKPLVSAHNTPLTEALLDIALSIAFSI